MAKEDHRGAFVVGSVLGGALGAAAALWTTPRSGASLRRTLGFESDLARGVTRAVKDAGTSATGAGQAARPLPAKALALVERAAAPLVGVKLGQTANNSQPGHQGGSEPSTVLVVDQIGRSAGVNVTTREPAPAKTNYTSA